MRIKKGKKVFTSLFYQDDRGLISRNSVVKLGSQKFVLVKYYFTAKGKLFVTGHPLSNLKGLDFTYIGIKLQLSYIFSAKLEERSITFLFSDVIDKVHLVQEFEKSLATHKPNGRYFVIEPNHKHHN